MARSEVLPDRVAASVPKEGFVQMAEIVVGKGGTDDVQLLQGGYDLPSRIGEFSVCLIYMEALCEYGLF